MIQVCPNGPRTSGVPVSPRELAEAVAGAVDAGASDVHLHPENPDGTDSLHPETVAAALDAVRAAVPRVLVGGSRTRSCSRTAPRCRTMRPWCGQPGQSAAEPGGTMLAVSGTP
jgi:uncharacterized protein (DUF849 family)